jgi:hypothetical protein
MPKPLTKKNFEFPLPVKVHKDMWNLIKEKSKDFNSITDYVRSLLKRDLNCDDYGNKENCTH